MEFKQFQMAVNQQFQKMQDRPLFRVTIDRDEIWAHYLASFPEGSNPIFRERTEHDCSCCRQFIREAGSMVTIDEKGKLESIWDCKIEDPNYQRVADEMSLYVRSKPIQNVYLHYQQNVGVMQNYEETEDGDVLSWNHFHVLLPKSVVVKKDDIGTKLGEMKAKHDVFERGLRELTMDSVDTVLELIDQNSLYRGEEHKFALMKFKEAKRLYEKAKKADTFAWFFMNVPTPSVTGIRNTSIGQLLINLSEGMDLEQAVGKFEAMVAPSNYKRPTALITKKMIDTAKKRVEELGLLDALPRRFAVAEDITINNVLFADKDTRPRMAGFDPFENLAATKSAVNFKQLDKVEEVPIATFIEKIVPQASAIEVLLENKHGSNLVSLIAPENNMAPSLFKWGNGFSWAYNGEMADSMKERVKAAGGSVTGDVRFSIQWNDQGGHNQCDYDAHCRQPVGHSLIYFGRKSGHKSGGELDVDIISPTKGKPAVENITFPDRHRMPKGEYVFLVNPYSRRGINDGFSAEIEIDGEIHSYEYRRGVSNNVTVARLKWDGKAFTIKHELDSASASKDVWGLKTLDYHKVKMMMYSPNHWDDKAVGNKHVFFMLEGCSNPDAARGFFNEFLTSELDKDRKVFEMLGAQMKADPHECNTQLSGLGFSSTQRNHVFCRVAGNFNRTVKVTF